MVSIINKQKMINCMKNVIELNFERKYFFLLQMNGSFSHRRDANPHRSLYIHFCFSCFRFSSPGKSSEREGRAKQDPGMRKQNSFRRKERNTHLSGLSFGLNGNRGKWSNNKHYTSSIFKRCSLI